MDSVLTVIAQQGFGYFLFSGSLMVIFFLYRENKSLSNEKVDLANKRIEDLQNIQNAFSKVLESNTRVADNTFTIVQNLQQILNSFKKYD